MALTHQRILEVAGECRAVAEDLKAAYLRAKSLIDTNSDLSVGWNGGGSPPNIDSAGNVDGTQFTRTDVGNVIGTFAAFVALIEGGAPSQGDHLGNINKLAAVRVSS